MPKDIKGDAREFVPDDNIWIGFVCRNWKTGSSICTGKQRYQVGVQIAVGGDLQLCQILAVAHTCG